MKGWFAWVWSFRTIIFLVGLIGLVLLLVSDHWGSAKLLLDSIGTAFITASVLALTVDVALKRRLVQDAFQAAFGYILPAELKPELLALYDVRIVCIRHQQECDLQRTGDVMVLHETISRTYRNVSDEVQKLPISLAIDEWYNKYGKSRILSLGYSRNKKVIDLISQKNDVHILKAELKGPGWATEETHVVNLGGGDEVTVWCEFEELKHLNDVHYMFFKQPTVRPRVTLIVKDDSNQTTASVSFAHRQDFERTQAGPNAFELPGTLLVLQPIQIRWWNKEGWTEGENLCPE